LFDIANKLHEMMKQGKGEDVIKPLLIELIDYTKYHLVEEEKALVSIGYSMIVGHQAAHKVFTQELNTAMVEVEKGRTLFVVIKIAKTVIDWLIDHIYAIDKKYLPEMAAAGIR
ncbi:MAG: hemerythrin, partial [Candidatus Electrothrix sp. AR1]|nr:hemerythrin [Candidatus Electrothrix sp. AR1]